MAAAPPTDRSPFFLTGDSHADLERMTRALLTTSPRSATRAR
jgi:hypothetical protein